MALANPLMALMFFISVLMPNGAESDDLTLTLQSTLIEPSNEDRYSIYRLHITYLKIGTVYTDYTLLTLAVSITCSKCPY